ncbi:hypothetical protein NM208_g7299 [Fusarium decemcellulare]|uniref:Uncharacterized protein n=1 Tax=Fusarium decemcellulare TaxID=57161 RepID=A0ACC1S9V8_9HYPO|nr:hypothetical protein NM208_g7299 [Fusarium decemcellulare]
MKAFKVFRAVLTAGVFGVAVAGLPHDANERADGDELVMIQKNFHGWVNPEDLAPMPQCIAQQDQSGWLRIMTECTRLRCTSHFGVICTHHQWLTQLSCLSTGFSPNAIKSYLPYCSRSILAKAQLYFWVRDTTGRAWLVDVGDANGLQNLSPVSLARGYANVDTTHKAPACLTRSASTSSAESFQHALGSCGFTSTTQHNGNAARPWEYNKSLRSMTTLSFDTVGYNLTGGNIGPAMLSVGWDRLDEGAVVVQRHLRAASLPDNWTAPLKIMGFTYIPVPDWRWPMCVSDMPRQVTELTDQCATDACQLDPDGYCQTRIDYVEWLHDLCGDVHGWDGLPANWRELAVLLPREMIPWRWSVKPTDASNISSVLPPGPQESGWKCPLNEWKLGSIVLASTAGLLAVFLVRGRGDRRSHPYQLHWLFGGILIASPQLLANWINGRIVQSTPGYESVPVFQLMLLWCSLPRLDWVTIFPAGARHDEASHLSSVAPPLVAETTRL